jgi:hypothetical protein
VSVVGHGPQTVVAIATSAPQTGAISRSKWISGRWVGVRYSARCSLLRDRASERMAADNLPTFVVHRYALLGVACSGRRLSGFLDQLVTLMVVASNQKTFLRPPPSVDHGRFQGRHRQPALDERDRFDECDCVLSQRAVRNNQRK